MISVILYGRNDNYGYNLHKRATLSLNCIAEILTHNDDEILFVDYNSKDDFPTFPEAVSDLLTEKCKKLLRIIRVREAHHKEFFAHKTKIEALEPISRNIAIKRMNIKNKWILSTNTDMVFVLKKHKSLSAMCRSLEDGYYCSPRFEIPESVWEKLDRKKPKQNIKMISKLSKSLHLEEVVEGDKWNLYDAPGDFQLFLRRDILKIGGFDETMLMGWHCDSNLNKRLHLLNGPPTDALPFIQCFHCDHTRLITPLHKGKSTFNDPNKYVYNLKQAFCNNEENWGLSNLELEMFTLNDANTQKYIGILEHALSAYDFSETRSNFTAAHFEKNPFPEPHALVFLVDHYLELGSKMNIGWFGEKGNFFENFKIIQSQLGKKTNLIDVNSSTDLIDLHGLVVSNPEINEKNATVAKDFFSDFFKIFFIKSNNYNQTKIIFINIMGTRYEGMIRKYFDTAKTPFSCRVLVGRRKEISKYKFMYLEFEFLYAHFLRYYLLEEMFRSWLLNNRHKHKYLFKIMRFIYYIGPGLWRK